MISVRLKFLLSLELISARLYFNGGLYFSLINFLSEAVFFFSNFCSLCCKSNTLVLSRFFFHATDLSLFLETGKGLTCAVFTESVDLRPD